MSDPHAHLYLNVDDVAGIDAFLRRHGLLAQGDEVALVEPAGQGNMNLVHRVVLASGRRLALKQSRPWVVKYPQIAAPFDRVLSEGAYFARVATAPSLAMMSPTILAFDAAQRAIVMEHVEVLDDHDGIYDDWPVPAEDLVAYIDYLSALHALPVEDAGELRNREMRALNHLHIFDFPLRAGSGLDLDAITPGLGEAAARLQASAAFVERARELGELYLADGPTLLHGDYYPGSWLRTPRGPVVIDPEFCFLGPAELDAGVLLAHLLLAGRGEREAWRLVARYRGPQGFSWALACQFAGIEIMRRLIGVAQLKGGWGLARKQELLALAEELVLSGEVKVGR
jgi:5-methylthioribose kinase